MLACSKAGSAVAGEGRSDASARNFLMKSSYRIGLLALVAAASAVGAFLLDPIPQDLAYHAFADRRALFGVPNFWNVATNLPFLLVGARGLLSTRRLAAPDLMTHYRIFCGAVALVAFGSGWYHLAPSHASLVCDRLPIRVPVRSVF